MHPVCESKASADQFNVCTLNAASIEMAGLDRQSNALFDNYGLIHAGIWI